MKYFSLLILAALFLPACSSSAPQVQTQQTNQPVTQKPKDELSGISHSVEPSLPRTDSNSTANSAANSASSTSGSSPNAHAIDVTAFNAEIQKAEKKYLQDKKNEQAKKDLAHAYFERGFALTEAAQYRSALGDFRRGLKLDPDDEPAQQMLSTILRIGSEMGRELPKEGEEPPPLPVDKDVAPAKP